MTTHTTLRTPTWSVYAFWIALSEMVGIAAALATQDAMETYGTTMATPPLSPPAIVFPIAWSVLYALMGIGAARIWIRPPSPERTQALVLFAVQLAMNFAWTFAFFAFEAYGFAFFWLVGLWAVVVAMAAAFRKADAAAAAMQIPYVAWLAFAAYLNAGVWYLN